MNYENTVHQLKRMLSNKNLTGDEHNAIKTAISAVKRAERLSRDDVISHKNIRYAKFPAVTNLYTEGWNDAIDSIIKNEPSIREGI